MTERAHKDLITKVLPLPAEDLTISSLSCAFSFREHTVLRWDAVRTHRAVQHDVEWIEGNEMRFHVL